MNYIQRLSVNDGLIILEEGYENLDEPWSEQFTAQVINTRDALVKAGLKNLGWTSPEDTARMTEEMRNLEDELLMAEDALRAHDAAAVDGWQPMEAAPLDGTIIVCRYAHHPARPAMFDGEAWVTWGAITESGPEPIGWRALTTQREDRADE